MLVSKSGDAQKLVPDEHSDSIIIDGSASLPEFSNEQLQASTLIVEFGASSDGRGFSLARILKRRGATGALIASGKLLPDQQPLAWACGFDAVLVPDEHFARCGNAAVWSRLATA